MTDFIIISVAYLIIKGYQVRWQAKAENRHRNPILYNVLAG